MLSEMHVLVVVSLVMRYDSDVSTRRFVFSEPAFNSVRHPQELDRRADDEARLLVHEVAARREVRSRLWSEVRHATFQDVLIWMQDCSAAFTVWQQLLERDVSLAD